LSKGTPAAILEIAFKTVNLNKNDVLVDLGCRDGRVPQLASLMTGCYAVGIENNPESTEKAKKITERLKLDKKVLIINDNLFNVDLSPYSVVYVYQSGGLLKRLSKKLRKEAKHTKIVALDYPLCKMSPTKTVVVGKRCLYFYGDLS